MLPQGNVQTINEEKNGKNESPLPDVDTPKRNPAIAAIDRLLFYSPLPNATVQKLEEAQEKHVSKNLSTISNCYVKYISIFHCVSIMRQGLRKNKIFSGATSRRA